MRAVGADVSGYAVSMGRLPMVAALPGVASGLTVTAGVGQNSISGPGVVAYPPGHRVYHLALDDAGGGGDRCPDRDECRAAVLGMAGSCRAHDITMSLLQ